MARLRSQRKSSTTEPFDPAEGALVARLLGTLGLDAEAHEELVELQERGGVEAVEARLVELDLQDFLVPIASYLCFLIQQRKLETLCAGQPERALDPAEIQRIREQLAEAGLTNRLWDAYLAADRATYVGILEQLGIANLCRPIARWLGAVMCRFVVQVPLPTCRVNVDAISFNHDVARLDRDALTIRRNRTVPVPVPEWVRGRSTAAADSPAAYCIQETAGNRLTIKVRFTANPGLPFAWVTAGGGGVLGAIDPIQVNFAGGVSVPPFVEIPLTNHTIGQGVRVENIEWRWRFRCPLDNAFSDMERTAHRVYVVMREPRGPWNQMPGSDQNPWTDALDVACTVTPTGGIADPFDALAAGLADKLNRGGVNANVGNLMYDVAATIPHYAGSVFQLTKFLERVNGGMGNGALVNCTDCACIITTLANLLGCDLWEGQIFTGEVNPTVPIGRGQWWMPGFGDLPSATAPSPGGLLLYHEVAWKADTVLGTPIWDICYLVNGFADPANPQRPHPTTRVIYYPYGVQYADPNLFDYREKLATATANNVTNTIPDGSTKTRRPVT